MLFWPTQRLLETHENVLWWLFLRRNNTYYIHKIQNQINTKVIPPKCNMVNQWVYWGYLSTVAWGRQSQLYHNILLFTKLVTTYKGCNPTAVYMIFRSSHKLESIKQSLRIVRESSSPQQMFNISIIMRERETCLYCF